MKRNWLFLGAVLIFLGGLGTGLVFLLQHEPTFYRRSLVPPGKDRKDLSKDLLGQFFILGANFKDGSPEPWNLTFSEAQINSYFAEDFIRLGDAETLRKQGITDPRLTIEQDHMRLAFRYTNALLSMIVSVDMRVWLVPKEMNVFAVEILARHAGALPFSVQSLLEEISDIARKNNIEVSWYRHNGHPVALLRVQSDRPTPSARFLRLDLHPGSLTIGGKSMEQLLPNAGLKKMLVPMGN